MRFALIYLCAFLAVTHQQYHRPIRLHPSYWTQPIPHEYQQVYYNDRPWVREFRPSMPINYNFMNFEMEDEQIETNDFGQPNVFETQPRIKGFKQVSNDEQQNPRFLYLNGLSTFTNPFYKTATFTITSTVNITSVQTCIPANQFAANVGICRRKRYPSLLNWNATDEDVISPSETQKIVTTKLPSLEKDSHWNINRFNSDDLSSSLDESSVDVTPEAAQIDQDSRLKRFIFNQYVASTTLTSYTFFSTTVTKTVNLGITTSVLSCRPAGYINC